MKVSLLVLVISFALNPACSQVVRLYGFEQPVSGGMGKGEPAVTGIDEMPATENSRYFVFAEIKKGQSVFIKNVWIKGKAFSFKIDSVKKLPYILQTTNGGEMIFRDTLLRSARGNVIQLTSLARLENVKSSLAFRDVIMTNDVVIIFGYRKKTMTTALKKIKRVSPLFTQ